MLAVSKACHSGSTKCIEWTIQFPLVTFLSCASCFARRGRAHRGGLEEDVLERIAAVTEGHKADVCLEVIGSKATFEQATMLQVWEKSQVGKEGT